jgi:hypothetical protein
VKGKSRKVTLTGSGGKPEIPVSLFFCECEFSDSGEWRCDNALGGSTVDSSFFFGIIIFYLFIFVLIIRKSLNSSQVLDQDLKSLDTRW